MLHPFISAAHARPSSAPVLALCASVHLGLLCAAVWSTGVVRPARLTEEAAERIHFAELPASAARSPTPRPPRRRVRQKRVGVERAFKPPFVLVAFDLVLPELPALPDYQPPDAGLEIGEMVDLANDVLHLGVRSSASSSVVAVRHHAYDESAVDRMASPDPANPKPRYPWRMRERGLEAKFVVAFVVDASGSVDTTTVELPTSVEKDFTTAAAEVLVRWHFVPAEVAGRRVRQATIQPFVFQMAEQYSSLSRP